MNIFEKKKKETAFNFNLAHNIRTRICHAHKGQNVGKTISIFDLLGCCNFFQKIVPPSTLW